MGFFLKKFSVDIYFLFYMCGYKFNNRFTTYSTSVNRICGEGKKRGEIKKIDYIARQDERRYMISLSINYFIAEI